MSPAQRLLLGTAQAGMELCWQAAWANFAILAFFSSPYPWGNALTAFLGAGLVGFIAHRRGWPVYRMVLLHLLGLAAALYWGLHTFYGGGLGLFDPAWLAGLGTGGNAVLAWLEIALKGGLSLWFWYGGIRWYLRPRDYQKMVHRFDLGLTVFLALFLVQFMLRARMETAIADPYALPLMAGFFCFGLLALALARAANRAGAMGRTSGGILHSAMGLLLAAGLLVAGAAAFSLPYLTSAAEAGYRVIKAVAAPLAPYALAVLRFFFAPMRSSSEPGGSTGGETLPAEAAGEPGSHPWLDILMQIFAILVAVALAALTALMLYFVLRHLLAWLRSRTGQAQKPPPFFSDLRDFLLTVLGWLARNLARLRPRPKDPVGAFRSLKRWGGRTGRPIHPGETPREYGRRLMDVFPRIKDEIAAIIKAHELAVYASGHGERQAGVALGKSLRRLASPALWPGRLRHRLTGR